MTQLMREILESEREGRRRLAALPMAEKVARLEKMRARHHLIATSPLGVAARHNSRAGAAGANQCNSWSNPRIHDPQ